MPSVVLYVVNYGREALRQRDPADEISFVAAVGVPKEPRQPSFEASVELAARARRIGDAPARRIPELFSSDRGRNLEVRGVSRKNGVLTILFFRKPLFEGVSQAETVSPHRFTV